ncbi:prenyltransferase [Microbacterium karelineae]|uniref:prenyltransferase n=1 Tax=Microbacterium karelineae TaxID=2654283 RepID=UPI0012E9A6D0|nr:prenyltransferase [Microbacterium karelineae]
MTGVLTAARALIVASRPLSWINTAYPFAAVMILTTGDIDVTTVVGTLFFLVPYNLLMYGVNDVFDYASDIANPRKGGVEGAMLPPRLHRTTLFAATALTAPFVVALAWLGAERPESWAMLGVSLFAVIAYSAPGLRFKEVPLLDSVTSSTHFVTPALCAIALAGTTLTTPLIVSLTAFFLWGMASHAFGAVQDIVPDRRAGIGSIATALGAAPTVRLTVALWSGAGALMLFTPWPAALVAAVAVPYVASALPYIRVSDERSGSVHRAWRRFLVINYAAGAAVTILLIVGATEGLFS